MKNRLAFLVYLLVMTIWLTYVPVNSVMNGGLSATAPLSLKASTVFEIMVSLALLILFPINLIRFIQKRGSYAERKTDLDNPSKK